MKPSMSGRPLLRMLLPLAGAAALMVGIACGGAEEPAAPAAAVATQPPAAAAATAAPSDQGAQQQPTAMADATAAPPTATPPPDATIRPTNTPAPTATPRAAPTPTPSAGPKYGGTLLMSAYADTKDWDPLGSSSLSSVISYSQLYNQIVQYDTVDTNDITGDLAEDWEISADGLTYTFHLRDNMQWTDGTEITASDIITTHSRYANPCNGAGRSGAVAQLHRRGGSGRQGRRRLHAHQPGRCDARN